MFTCANTVGPPPALSSSPMNEIFAADNQDAVFRMKILYLGNLSGLLAPYTLSPTVRIARCSH